MKLKYLPSLFLAAFIISSQFCLGQLNPKIAPIVKQFENQINADLTKDNLHGSISAAIVKDNKVIWSEAFGYASREKDIPANTGSIYRIGSITKTFTATLLMLMVEDGKLKLDDPVENYLPEIKNLQGYDAAHKMTFRQLASHTSGLNREPAMKDFDVGPLDKWQEKCCRCSLYATGAAKNPGAAAHG
jgi:CubicO group peptidase (beta-lactamase class C family)